MGWIYFPNFCHSKGNLAYSILKDPLTLALKLQRRRKEDLPSTAKESMLVSEKKLTGFYWL